MRKKYAVKQILLIDVNLNDYVCLINLSEYF